MFNEYYFGGMNLAWWALWLILLFWIFVTPYDIPGTRKKKESPLNLLQKQFAAGLITYEEYLEWKEAFEGILINGPGRRPASDMRRPAGAAYGK